MTNARYNPFREALKALTTDDAISFYQVSAWGAAQRAVDDSIITATYVVYAIHQAAAMAYGLGQAVGEAHFNAVADHNAPKALPESEVAGLLPPAKVRKHSRNTALSHNVAPFYPGIERAIAKNHTVKRLKAILSAKGVEYTTKDRKAQLVAKLARA